MARVSSDYVYDVFVSYSSRDVNRVLRAASWLRDHGLRVWLDRWMIQPGEPISIKIEDALASSRVLLAFLSRFSLRSHWPTIERHSAIFRDPAITERRFVPVLLEEIKSLPPLLANYKHVDLTTPTHAAYRELLQACGAITSPRKVHPRRRSPVEEVVVHHIDDEPAHIRWIPGAIMNRLLLTNYGSVDASSFAESAKETSFVIHIAAKQIRVRYLFHVGLASLKRRLKDTATCRQLLVADLMLPSGQGRFANDGLDALRIARGVIPRTRRFVLTGYPQAITPQVQRLVLPMSVFHKPADVPIFVDAIIQAFS
jgi:TIR domain